MKKYNLREKKKYFVKRKEHKLLQLDLGEISRYRNKADTEANRSTERNYSKDLTSQTPERKKRHADLPEVPEDWSGEWFPPR